jgi:hypothetical protein
MVKINSTGYTRNIGCEPIAWSGTTQVNPSGIATDALHGFVKEVDGQVTRTSIIGRLSGKLDPVCSTPKRLLAMAFEGNIRYSMSSARIPCMSAFGRVARLPRP